MGNLLRNLLFVAAWFLATPAQAAVISTFGVNPTSAAGAFSNDPLGPGVGGAFTDQFTFTLVGGPAFVSVVTASNTFAFGGVTGPFGIQNFAGAIFQTFDNIIGNGDDVLRFGPQFATMCASGLCQELNGNGIILPGMYYLQIQGIAGTLAGYGGNLSVAAVPIPALGLGVPLLLAAFAGVVALRKRRRRVAL